MSEKPPRPGGRERRRHPRLAVADLPLALDGRGALRVRDLSRSGVCVFAEQPLRMMTHVRFELPLAGGEPVTGSGVVVRCERISPALGHYEIAIFFQDLGPGGEARLTEYLAARIAEGL